MSAAVFELGDDFNLTVMHKRSNWNWQASDLRAAWGENNRILAGRYELEEDGGTWLGVSRDGRVAFLVNDINQASPCDLLPTLFLRGNDSPHAFASRVNEINEDIILGDTFHLIVGDFHLNSMVYLGTTNNPNLPWLQIADVGVGVHTLSIEGLDSAIPMYADLAHTFTDAINGDQALMDIAMAVMTDMNGPNPHFQEMMNAPDEPQHGTTSTTALKINATGQVLFYERYLENGQWRERDFVFGIE
ncbi:hypothetical protein AALP_AA1G225000 [Arabis alpina]|uniref:NRDE family protein n=1 Tax=Arabis alpina TaxID=50452 RepID=A0A087HPX8_ARAAL|nr:hypothetical protein AALP_AA1G225000 [Arabis alpina]